MDRYRCRHHIKESARDYLADVLCATPGDRDAFFELIEEDPEILDDALDSPQLAGSILDHDNMGALSPHLYFYVGIRHYMAQDGLGSRELADYVTSMCTHFLYAVDWSNTPLSEPEQYTDSIRAGLQHEAWQGNREAVHSLHIHIGNYCLFLTGLLTNIVNQSEAKGGRGVQYYKDLGVLHYRSAAAFETDLSETMIFLADHFDALCGALNGFGSSDFIR